MAPAEIERRALVLAMQHFYRRVWSGNAAVTRFVSIAVVTLSTLVVLDIWWGIGVALCMLLAVTVELRVYRWFSAKEASFATLSHDELRRVETKFLNLISLVVAVYSLPYTAMVFGPMPGALLALLFSLGTMVVITAQHVMTRNMVFRTIPAPALTLIASSASFVDGWMSAFCACLAMLIIGNVIAMTQASYNSANEMIEAQLEAEESARALEARRLELLDADAAKGDLIASLTKAQKEAETATHRLQFISDNTIDAIGLMAHTGRAKSISAAITHILGWSPDEFIDKSDDLIHPDDLEPALAAAEDFIKNPRQIALEQRYRHRDGHYVEVEARFNPVRDPETGEFTGCVVTMSDITARKKNEAELGDAQRRLADQTRQLTLISDNGSDAVGLLDSDGDVLTVSRGITRILGWEPEEFKARAIRFIHPDDVDAVIQANSGEWLESTPYRVRIRILNTAGEYVWTESRIRPVLNNETGRYDHAVFVTSDISAQRAYEIELDNSRRDAEAANIAKSQFLATMSHELRTPMSGIMSMLELLKRSDLNDVQRDQAQTATSSANNLLLLLNDILDYSKLEANQIKLELVPANVEKIVRDVATLFAQQAHESGIDLDVEATGVIPDWLEVDPTRLRQILINLMGNAIKFTKKGAVRTTLSYAANTLKIEVRDTGIGIPEAVCNRLFQRFVQADASTSRKFGGSGLGLAICKQLTELMAGKISVSSVPEHGSVFTVIIKAPPVEGPVMIEDGVQTDDAGEGSSRPLRILVAEDHPVNQKIIAAFLAPFDHEVTIVGDGQQALDMLSTARFDLILMDIQMPVMDGIAATKAIRASDIPISTIPIVALTANAMVGDREAYLASGMDDYISKPIDPSRLTAVLERFASELDRAEGAFEQHRQSA